MMAQYLKILIVITISVLSLAMPIPAEFSNPGTLTVTFAGNEGFLIDSDGKKILIDALYGGFEADWCVVPSDSIVNLMTAAMPPFDGVDVIAVTHAHADHLTPKIAVDHLINNPDGIMICPPQVADRMVSIDGFDEIKDRLRVIPAPGDSAIKMTIGEIKIEVLPTHHGVSMRTDTVTGETYDRHRDVQHLEYLFNLGGWTLYHSGDSPQYDINKDGGRRFGLDTKSIDIAF